MTTDIKTTTADRQFEADALAALDEYQRTGIHVTQEEICALFNAAKKRATELTVKS